jgi:tRNA modification GTPase
VSNIIREEDTIVALATPPGPGGIGIVRISGYLALHFFKSVFLPVKPIETIQSHRLYYGWAYDPENNSIIDEVLAVLMKAPHSYTKEDVLEIQCHSGPAILRQIIETLIGQGARLADPGEFTKRAFLNGRIDLAQAEAVLDLTLASGDIAGQFAIRQLQGYLSTEIKKIRYTIKESIATLEVAIDYPEEEIEIMKETQLKDFLITGAQIPLQDMINASARGKIYKEGIDVLIIGRPNVGKSSLLNALACEEKAIVTSVPGTTRDIIEATINLEGILVRLIDTAGIRQDPDPIETIGIKKVLKRIKVAQIALWIIDLSEPLCHEDFSALETLDFLIKRKKVFIVFNKIDMLKSWKSVAQKKINKIFSQYPEMIDSPWTGTSALTGEGLTQLSKLLVSKLLNEVTSEPPDIVPNLRQKDALETAHKSVTKAINNISQGISPDLISIDLRDAMNVLGEITGDNINDEILDHIFSRFCLGK